MSDQPTEDPQDLPPYPGDQRTSTDSTFEDPVTGSMQEQLREIKEEQDADLEKFATDFLKNVIRLRGVRIDRASYLRQELRKLAPDAETLERAITSTPVEAGITVEALDKVAEATINFETNKSAGASFIAGLPGGLAMFASIPADITQYYVHAFRIMQKLAYLYGWKDFISDLEDIDDETIGKLALFLGVMMGVGGAASSLTTFAAQVARPALQKQIASQALTKTAWYGPMKQVLKLIGIKVTKDSFAKGVTKAIPIAGGVISGGMTLVSLGSQSRRLRDHLRTMPPPGSDAATYLAAVHAADRFAEENRSDAQKFVEEAASNVKHVTDEAGAAASQAIGAAGDAAAQAVGAVGDAAAQAIGEVGKFFQLGFGKKDSDKPRD